MSCFFQHGKKPSGTGSEVDGVLQQGTLEAAGSFLGISLSSPGSVTDKFPELGTQQMLPQPPPNPPASA